MSKKYLGKEVAGKDGRTFRGRDNFVRKIFVFLRFRKVSMVGVREWERGVGLKECW